jgi:hypothetical protein
MTWPSDDLPMWVLTTILLPSPLCHSQKNQNVFLDLWSQCNCRPSFISILLGVQTVWTDMYEGTGFNSLEDPGWALSM